MQIKELFSHCHQHREATLPTRSVLLKPTGDELLTSDGARLSIFSLPSFNLVSSPKKHRGPIHYIAHSPLHPYFATAATDNQVIVWNSTTNKGIVKFPLSSAPTSLSFSPTSPTLLACSADSISIWYPTIRQVSPTPIPSKILSSAFNSDGTLFALGLLNGTVSVRSSETLDELYTHHLHSPVFALCFSKDLLICGDFDNRMTIHQVRESKLLSTNLLPACPTVITTFQSSLIVADISGGIRLYNDDGHLLCTVAELNEWIWSISIGKNDKEMAVGLEDGRVLVYTMGMRPVVAVGDKAFVVRSEVTKIQLRIMNTELVEDIEFIKPVQDVAVNEGMVAVRFDDEVSAYSWQVVGDGVEIDKVGRFDCGPCKFFFSFSTTFVMVYEKSAKVLSLSGTFLREFNFGFTVSSACVSSTFNSREAVLIGGTGGEVTQVFVNHRFSHTLIRHTSSISQMAISQMKTKVAVIDDKGKGVVYNVKSGEVQFIEDNVESVAFNELDDDIVAFGDSQKVIVREAGTEFTSVTFPCEGKIVKFSGLTLFTVIDGNLHQSDVSLWPICNSLVRSSKFDRAFRIASLGSTRENWIELSLLSLLKREFTIAIKCASHANDVKLLYFIESLMRLGRSVSDDLLSAEVDAWSGEYDSAAKTWSKTGDSERAVQMYFDIRQFDRLRQYLSGDRMKKFAQSQAEGFEKMGEIVRAAELYVVGGLSEKAVNLLKSANLPGQLVNLSKSIDHSETVALQSAAEYLMSAGYVKEATDLLAQLDDVGSLARVRVYMKDWDEAISLAKMHPELLPEVFLPYAKHLYEEDMHFESLVAFFIAGRVDEALRSLDQLLQNAILMHKHEDAAFFIYGRTLGLAANSENVNTQNIVFEGLQLAKAYLAFSLVYEDSSSPFTVRERGISFRVSRFVVAYINSFLRRKPETVDFTLLRGISYPMALFSLINEANAMGEYRLMRWCAKELKKHIVPPAVEEAVEFAILRVIGLEDESEGETCERCGGRLFSSEEGPLMWCSECLCPVEFSSYTFGVLPVIPVEVSEEGTSGEDVAELVDPAVSGRGKPAIKTVDLIDSCMKILVEWKENSKVGSSLILNPQLESVFRCRGCNSLFCDEDFEAGCLERGCCPICRTPIDGEGEGDSEVLKQLREFAQNVPIEF